MRRSRVNNVRSTPSPRRDAHARRDDPLGPAVDESERLDTTWKYGTASNEPDKTETQLTTHDLTKYCEQSHATQPF